MLLNQVADAASCDQLTSAIEGSGIVRRGQHDAAAARQELRRRAASRCAPAATRLQPHDLSAPEVNQVAPFVGHGMTLAAAWKLDFLFSSRPVLPEGV